MSQLWREQRFCVVSFVWGPRQQTPIHDHMVWGVIGVLRGSALSQRYRRLPKGLVPEGTPERLAPGDVTAVSPAIGDIPDPLIGAQKAFVSGYSNARSRAA